MFLKKRERTIAHMSDLHFVSRKSLFRDGLAMLTGLAIGGLFTTLFLKYPHLRQEIRKLFKALDEPALVQENQQRVEWETLLPLLPAAALIAFESVYLCAQAAQSRHSATSNFEILLAHFQENTPDQIVISGDLTNVSHADEFRLAYDYIKKLETIVGSGNIFVIPGNHDADVGVFHKESEEKKLENYLKSFRPYHETEDKSLFPTLQQKGDLCFVGLDTSGNKFWQPGKIDDDQLNRTSDALNKALYKDKYKILVIHHHLSNRSTLPDDISLSATEKLRLLTTPSFSGVEQVLQLCTENSINCVLHGHVHNRYSIPEIPRQECAGATLNCTENSSSMSYNLFRWTGSELHKEVINVPLNPS